MRVIKKSLDYLPVPFFTHFERTRLCQKTEMSSFDGSTVPISSVFDSCVYARFAVRRETLLRLRKEITDAYTVQSSGMNGDQHYEELKRKLNEYPMLVNAILKDDRYSIDDTVNSQEFSKRVFSSSLKDKELWFAMKQFHHGSESVIKCLRNPKTKNKIIQHSGNKLNTKSRPIPEFCETVGNVGEAIAARLLPRVIPGEWAPSGKLVWDEYTVFGVTPDYIKYAPGTVQNPFDGNPIGIAEVKSTALSEPRRGLRPKTAQRWMTLTRKSSQHKEFVKKRDSRKLQSLKWLSNETYNLVTTEVNSTISWKSVTIGDSPLSHERLDPKTGFLIGDLDSENMFATPLVGKTWCQTIGEMMSIAGLTSSPVIEGVIVFVNLSYDNRR